MSQDADTTLSGPDERNPNKPAFEWPELAARLHDHLVGLLTRKPDAAADLAPAIDLAARLRAEGERHWRSLALFGSSLGEQAAAPDSGMSGAGVLDEFASIARPRMIREVDRFIRAERVRPMPLRRESAKGWAEPSEFVPIGRDAVDLDPGLGVRDASGRRFVVEGRSLHEYSPDEGRPPISVSEADYERIARVLARLSRAATGATAVDEGSGRPGFVQAKAVREATADSERTAPLEPRLVSLTHVYICLRCWQAVGLIRRQSGGWFMPVPVGDGPFHEAALDVWRRLASAGGGIDR